MNVCYIGLGSNQGNREGNILRAVQMLNEFGHVKRIASNYHNPAIGMAKGHDFEFVNTVCEFWCSCDAHTLLEKIHCIESEFGRERSETEKWSRKIDLDILLFNNETINHERLTIPHPEIHGRKFVLIPLSELLPDYTIPAFKKTISELKEALEKMEI